MVSQIGLDLKTYTLKCAGIGRYTLNLVNTLLERGKHDFEYSGFISKETEQARLLDRQIQLIQGQSFNIQSTIIRSLLSLPLALRFRKLNLFHSMDQSVVGLLGKTSYKKVTTIHDMIVYRHPEFFTSKHVKMVKWMTKRSIKKADHIIVPSYSTKQDILRFFPKTSLEKISVTPLACDPLFVKKEADEVKQFKLANQLPEKYLLSLGTNEPRKNLENLIKAFQRLKANSLYEDVSLVLVGGKGWLNALGEFSIEELKKHKIFHLGFVEDEKLPFIYSGAYGFVYPSFYEGFGLPVVEALNCGIPVITSNLSSLPEVAGEAGLYVDPYSIDSIQAAMENLLTDDTIYRRLCERTLQQSHRFSWQKTALETEVVYQKVLS